MFVCRYSPINTKTNSNCFFFTNTAPEEPRRRRNNNKQAIYASSSRSSRGSARTIQEEPEWKREFLNRPRRAAAAKQISYKEPTSDADDDDYEEPKRGRGKRAQVTIDEVEDDYIEGDIDAAEAAASADDEEQIVDDDAASEEEIEDEGFDSDIEAKRQRRARVWRQEEAQIDHYSIDKVLDSRLVNSKGEVVVEANTTNSQRQHQAPELSSFSSSTATNEQLDTEYLIQWTGSSHLYDSWHTHHAIIALCSRGSGKGLKKLSNFISRKEELADQLTMASPEEKEQINVQLEMLREEREEWSKVEKIIGRRE